jgi:hypothetical protein
VVRTAALRLRSDSVVLAAILPIQGESTHPTKGVVTWQAKLAVKAVKAVRVVGVLMAQELEHQPEPEPLEDEEQRRRLPSAPQPGLVPRVEKPMHPARQTWLPMTPLKPELRKPRDFLN